MSKERQKKQEELKNLSDSELIKAFYSDRESALVRDEVGRRYFAYIDKWVNAQIFNPKKYERRAETVEDLKYKIFYKFIFALEKGYLEDYKKVLGYLKTTIFNSAKDFYSQKFNMETFPDDFVPSGEVYSDDKEIEKISYNVKIQKLDKYLEDILNPREKEVFQLYLAQKSNSEIAQAMGIKQEYVASLKTRVKVKIKKFLENNK